MMGYSSMTFGDAIKLINEQKMLLPALQRHFVWDTEKIEILFDSLMRGYPIGTFLFWKVNRDDAQNYVFYNFMDHYHEKNNRFNKIANKPFVAEEITGILDGQQRLSSIYIALQGTYAYKLKGYSIGNEKAYPERKLYLNLFYAREEGSEEDFGIEYWFEFLTEKEAKDQNEKELWFPVYKVLEWGEKPKHDEYFDTLVDEAEAEVKQKLLSERNDLKPKLSELHAKIMKDGLLNYFEVKNKALDDILDVFVRVNSSGVTLSKTDLLFSTIVASWAEGREEIEETLKAVNAKGFSFDIDFIMRTCLVTCDLDILFKVKTFEKSNVQKIKNNWEKISDSMLETAELLKSFGFSGYTLTSNNAAIPIAYYIFNSGKITQEIKKEWKKYIVHALLKKTFGSHGDQILKELRDLLKDNKNFEFEQIKNHKFKSGKEFAITDEEIDEFLEYRKGREAFIALSILYDYLKFDQITFHMDHIHPDASFTDAKLLKIGLDEEKIKDWKNKKDRLPNLQIMEGGENISKNKTPFMEWINEKSGIEKSDFETKNFIPVNENYDLKNFDSFYEARKKLLRNKLKEKLND